MEPRVTFIIAHHNYQQYLGDAIESALNQTYNNIHICVIDDCSDDQEATFEIICKYTGLETMNISYEKNITTYESSNMTYVQLDGGPYKQAFARNRGIEACWDNTEFFAILDADDTNYPTKVEHSIKVMLNNPMIGAVYTDTNIVMTENNRIVREYREPYDYYRLMQECIVHSGCIIPKTILQEVLENGVAFDETMPPCEDYDLWVRIAEKFILYHLPEPLVYVRVHPNNSTNTSTHNHRISRIKRIFQKKELRNK